MKPKYPSRKLINYRTKQPIRGRQVDNSIAKQLIIVKPIEHITLVHACVMVKIGIFCLATVQQPNKQFLTLIFAV